MGEKVIYKGIKLLHNRQESYVEVIIEDESFKDAEDYVFSMSRAMEYITNIDVRYIIINKLHSDFGITNALKEFTRDHIIMPMRKSGIRRMVMLVKPTVYEKYYKNIEHFEPFMVAFTEHDKALAWIKQDLEFFRNL